MTSPSNSSVLTCAAQRPPSHRPKHDATTPDGSAPRFERRWAVAVAAPFGRRPVSTTPVLLEIQLQRREALSGIEVQRGCVACLDRQAQYLVRDRVGSGPVGSRVYRRLGTPGRREGESAKRTKQLINCYHAPLCILFLRLGGRRRPGYHD